MEKDRLEQFATFANLGFLSSRLINILNGRNDEEKERMLLESIDLLESAKKGLEHTRFNPEGVMFLDYKKNLENYLLVFPYFGIGGEPKEFDCYIDTLKFLKENKPVDELYTKILIGFFDYLFKYSTKQVKKCAA
ncbi:MAG: hypothetical protein PHF86_11990 [Candidatus Nanoarchaeia archaeon]|nr:hypothetical protein [Candidatus Nanoarchaeia archaeon]